MSAVRPDDRLSAVRSYGPALAVLRVDGRRARISVPDTPPAVLDVGEEIGSRAVANRAVAGLPIDVGLVAVAAGEAAPGVLDALVRAARATPRAGALGSPGAAASTGQAFGEPPGPRVRTAVRRTLAVALRRPPARLPSPLLDLERGPVLLRRAAWDSVDGWDTRIPDPARADADLAERIERAGWLVVPVPDPTGRHGMLDG